MSYGNGTWKANNLISGMYMGGHEINEIWSGGVPMYIKQWGGHTIVNGYNAGNPGNNPGKNIPFFNGSIFYENIAGGAAGTFIKPFNDGVPRELHVFCNFYIRCAGNAQSGTSGWTEWKDFIYQVPLGFRPNPSTTMLSSGTTTFIAQFNLITPSGSTIHNVQAGINYQIRYYNSMVNSSTNTESPYSFQIRFGGNNYFWEGINNSLGTGYAVTQSMKVEQLSSIGYNAVS